MWATKLAVGGLLCMASFALGQSPRTLFPAQPFDIQKTEKSETTGEPEKFEQKKLPATLPDIPSSPKVGPVAKPADVHIIDAKGKAATIFETVGPINNAPVLTTIPRSIVPRVRVIDSGERSGPILPEDLNSFAGFLPNSRGIRLYGWADMGYTYSTAGSGLLAIEPRPNQFGNESLAHQLAVVLDKPLRAGEFNMGFNATFYAGSDPALLAPLGGFAGANPRFGADFRQLYASTHLPVFTEGGIDIKAGRMNSMIGHESALAPYRPFYSNSYQWFYGQDTAFTGVLANLHVNQQLDVINGITFGANTFFTRRGNDICYIGQVNYWTDANRKTLLSASTHIGNQAVLSAGPRFIGDADYMTELRIQHSWNQYLTQIIQSDNVWASGVPTLGTTEFYSLYSIWVFHATKHLDFNVRAEWARDVQGARTGTANHYGEVTLGFDFHPINNLRLRPEVRGDFANNPAFGPNGTQRNQLTLAIDALLSF